MTDLALVEEKFDRLADAFTRFMFSKSMSSRIESYELLSDYMNAGTPLMQALQSFEKQAVKEGKGPAHPDRRRLNAWIDCIKQGKRFSDAILGWVPERERMQIEASESVGNLIEGLERAVESIERAGEIRSIWVGAMTYPAFLVAMTVYVINIYGDKVIPKFTVMIPVERWEGNPKLLYTIGYISTHYWLAIAVGLAMLAVVVAWSLPRLTGKIRAVLDNLPPYSFYKIDEGAAFMVALTAMLEAGKPILPAIEQIRETSSPWLKHMLDPAIRAMKRGKSFGEGLELSGNKFPDSKLISLIVLHSGRDSFLKALPKQTDRWVNSQIKSMRKKAEVINKASMMLVAAFAGWLCVAMSDMSSFVTSAMQSIR